MIHLITGAILQIIVIWDYWVGLTCFISTVLSYDSPNYRSNITNGFNMRLLSGIDMLIAKFLSTTQLIVGAILQVIETWDYSVRLTCFIDWHVFFFNLNLIDWNVNETQKN